MCCWWYLLKCGKAHEYRPEDSLVGPKVSILLVTQPLCITLLLVEELSLRNKIRKIRKHNSFPTQVRSGNCGNFWNVKNKNKEERINPASPK